MKMKLLYVPMAMAVMSALVAPTTTTAKPTTTTAKPTTTTAKPTTTTAKPTTTTAKPTTTAAKPTTTTAKPTTTTAKPTTTTAKPTTTTAKPTTTAAKPTTTTAKPTTTTAKPTTTTAKPTTTAAKPTTTTAKPTTRTTVTPWTRTTGPYGLNLNGKMFTLSLNRGAISFYPPYFSPTSPPWPSQPYTTAYPPWTPTAPPTRGVSVCLRYLTDQQPRSLFTLSPSSRTPLKLGTSNTGWYTLSFDRYSYTSLNLHPDIWFWSNIGQDIWTRVCVTVDTVKNVAQVFSGARFSIRKMLPANIQYVWSGEPVIDFSGFDGQVTDVQVWDYPLHYKEIFNYMTNGVYTPYRGSVLTWSSISYSPRGNVLLEDAYKWQERQPISSRGRGRRPKGEKKKWGFFNVGEMDERKTEQL